MKLKFAIYFTITILFAFKSNAQNITTRPRLERRGNVTQLIVNQKPFLILGGELGNSSASDISYMKPHWQKFNQMNLNTILTPVYWELMEPTEGKFSFDLIDKTILKARQQGLKVILLWFASWKNSMSCYAPLWVKSNTTRFPRAIDEAGSKQEILSPLYNNNLVADKKAFVELMKHIKAFDDKDQTVLMVQVENEIGMIPAARDHSTAANEAYNNKVPADLVNYLQKNKSSLLPEIKEKWDKVGNRISGTWEELFGKNINTEEIFMAYSFGRYVNEIASAGKSVYNIPMFVNAALNRPNRKPGEYPSAGPLPHLIDIWKASAPAIDILSPDIYFPELKHWADLYTRSSNPLLIPETTMGVSSAAKSFYVFGHFNAIGYSPFSIESTNKPTEEPVGKSYAVIKQLTPLITEYQKSGQTEGVLLDKANDSTQVTLGGYTLTIKHDFLANRTPVSPNVVWPEVGGIIVCVGPGEYYVGGTGIVVTFKPSTSTLKAGIGYIDEGKFVNNNWVSGRRMNGDQNHQGRHLRIGINQYNIQHIKLYSY